MIKKNQRTRIQQAGCEVHFDDLHRQLYATDASIYRIVPEGVAFPRTAAEASAVIQAAAEAGVSVTPRGAGSGLAGGAVGDGLIVEFAQYNRQISEFDPERRTVRVAPGVVLDQLNDYLKPHGLWFGPDVATSSRATLGGMIANNSSGARAPIYGTTIDHVVSLDVVLPDGRIETVGDGHEAVPELRDAVGAILDPVADIVRERFPDEIVKQWSGYCLDDWVRSERDLSRIVCGSEGTLAGIWSAELKLVPLPNKPGQKGLALFFFSSVAEAMQATVDLLEVAPAAIENVDRVLFEQTRGQLAFQATRALLRLDEEPCESFLMVELYDDVEDKIAALSKRHIGLRNMMVTDPQEMEMVWNLRKAGLSLLTGRQGPAKPVAGIEDVAVRPHQLPEYVAGLQKLMDGVGLEGSFYGHAASGLLHIRPIVDLHKQADIDKYRKLAQEVSSLTLQFKGSFAAEHGVGIARTEFLEEQVGPELMNAMTRIKTLFDPKNVMNPGKVIGDGRFRIDTHLRQGDGHRIELPFEPVLAFASQDGPFVGNLEQCNGCGGCRKDAPTMCPTFIATGDEVMSTRGRSNTIRSVLEQRAEAYGDPLRAADLGEALDFCLSCKACAKECPSNVDMALLKSELLHAQQRRDGVSLRDRMVSDVDLLGKLGCMTPALANFSLTFPPIRALMERILGLSAKRPLPLYAKERFDHWFAKRSANGRTATQRGRKRSGVILWDDCFARYNEPNIGQAAVKVLEAAGFEVTLPQGRKCCGRPAFSVGRLDKAKRYGLHNVDLFVAQGGDEPILFLEPSCFSMFKKDYAELNVPDAARVASRCFLFEQFIADLLDKEPDALTFSPNFTRVAIHAHCHAKALIDTGVMTTLAQRLPNTTVEMLDTGCCGMAGAFGMVASKYDLSLQVAQPLVDKVNALEPGAQLVASGTSCRHQIGDLTERKPVHMAELLASAIE